MRTIIKGDEAFLEDFQNFYEKLSLKEDSELNIDDLKEDTTSGDGKRSAAVTLLALFLSIPAELLKDLIKDYVKDLFKRDSHTANIKMIGPAGELTITLNNQSMEDIQRLIAEFKGEITEIQSVS